MIPFKLDHLLYVAKYHAPTLFSWLSVMASVLTVIRYSNIVKATEKLSGITGSIQGEFAEIRALRRSDGDVLVRFLERFEEPHLDYFRPHAFNRRKIEKVIQSSTYMTYGLFVKTKLIGYALLKISPTGSAYIGLIISSDFQGFGLGKLLVEYLYWQGSLTGLRVRSTISRANSASLAAHRAVADFRVIAELPNRYIMIEYPTVSRAKPELTIN
jgi:RimJ/RimL family protein N-acetyltransferase